MALKGVSNPTIMDVAKRLDPDNSVAAIIEILNEQNEVLWDMTMKEGNLPTGHKTTVRTGLPAVTWRKLNYGVKASKSRTAQVTDTVGMLESYSKIDKDLAELNGNTAEFRLSEDVAFLESMGQQFAETLFYGDTDEHPERFMGLAPRFNDLSAENAENIIDAEGTGSDLTSIWLVCWGENTVHGIYPKGSTAGIQHKDLGEDTVSDGDGGEYQALRTHYQLKTGLTVKDWRYVVRIANIDPSALTKDAESGPDLVDLMIQAAEKIPNASMGRCVFYMSQPLRSYLRRQVKNDKNVRIGMEEVAGKRQVMFDEYPLRRTDAITHNEAQVVDQSA